MRVFGERGGVSPLVVSTSDREADAAPLTFVLLSGQIVLAANFAATHRLRTHCADFSALQFDNIADLSAAHDHSEGRAVELFGKRFDLFSPRSMFWQIRRSNPKRQRGWTLHKTCSSSSFGAIALADASG